MSSISSRLRFFSLAGFFSLALCGFSPPIARSGLVLVFDGTLVVRFSIGMPDVLLVLPA